MGGIAEAVEEGDIMNLVGNWSYPTTMKFGAGRISELAEACKSLGMKRPLLVTDKGLAPLPITAQALDILEAAGLGRGIFSEVDPNPSELNLAAGVAAYKAGGHDGVIAFGGGSGLDLGKMVAFHAEERRDAVLSYVIDLYAGTLEDHKNAVSIDEAFLDKSGYYALARKDPDNHDHPKERQLDFFGGLRWRYEEHMPANRRKIDRVSIFKAKVGLELREDFTFNDEEYNTYACEWHNNLTIAVCSFRTAKALKRNPGSTFDIDTFRWHNSVPFKWHSRQLLDLGLMEPGQWF